MKDLNSSTRAYLENYFLSRDPKFAVLLSAPWGAGKTHLINDIIKGEVEKPLYVSLFGVGSRADVDRAIVRALWPKTDKGMAKVGTQVKNFVSGLEAFGFSADLSKVDLTEIMLTKLPKTLIFDDLERATLPLTELLGAINKYVEHERKRVVLLANEDSLWGEDGRKEKEKLIGQTLSLVADFDAAIRPMIKRYAPKSKSLLDRIVEIVTLGFFKVDYNKRSFLDRNIETIKDAFVRAGYSNLRSLGQAIWEFDRLFKVLDTGLVENEEGMKELLFVFLAITLEMKSGNFSRQDLKLRGGMDFDKNPKYEKLRQARQKFDNDQIQHGRFQTVLPYELAEDIICDGRNDRRSINEILARTSTFHVAIEEDEWQTVWWAFDREEDLVEPAVSSMEEKFSKREYLDPGTVLLVFSSRLGLPEMGYAKSSLNDIEVECMNYISDLQKAKTLLAYDPIKEAYHSEGFGYSDTGHLGMGFPRDETHPKGPPFNRLYAKMQTAQMEAYQNSSAEEAGDLLKLLEDKTDLFAIKISGNVLKDAVFASKPVLHHLPPEKFVAILLALPQKHRKHVLNSLENRYKRNGDELKSEKQWLKNVYDSIQTELEKRSVFLKWQTQTYLNHSIRKTLNSWEEEDADLPNAEQSNGNE